MQSLGVQSLASRLEELRLTRQPIPVTTFLQIVALAPYDCYINYCEGAYILYNWLTTNGTVQLAVPKEYKLAGSLPKVHDLQANYYVNELAKILANNGVQDVIPSLDTYGYYTRLITYLLREIL